VKMGFDDDYSAVTLMIPGGRIRPNTQAIVAMEDRETSDIATLARCIGGFDLGFLGVNGIDAEAGFTTHDNAEARNKTDILQSCRRKVILGDSSKVGLTLEYKFACFDDDVTLVVDNDQSNDLLQRVLQAHPDKVLLADVPVVHS
jgi:DeoR/GlpR family transcriptional regulator of sugar metabolism